MLLTCLLVLLVLLAAILLVKWYFYRKAKNSYVGIALSFLWPIMKVSKKMFGHVWGKIKH